MEDRIEKYLFNLCKTRPEMACIFQVPIKKYPRFTLYRTYVICYELNHIASYITTELRDDIILLEDDATDLNQVLLTNKYDPQENVIYSFLLKN